MTASSKNQISATTYNRAECDIGVVHLGYGAFHRAHQAVYVDDYIELSGDTRWGIAAVNLRAAESEQFQNASDEITRHDGYYLKSISASGQIEVRRVRSHVAFFDWSREVAETVNLLSRSSVHLVTITVTESGYYIDPNGDLNPNDPLIADEISGGAQRSIYAYLRAALNARKASSGAPLTIANCDNIRQNGKMLNRNLMAYLAACGDTELADWVEVNVAFPCSMVDRITPRNSADLCDELSALVGEPVAYPVLSEDFMQWVLQDSAAADMPDLGRAGVTVTPDVNPYEETKIRVLNGGHTGLTYFAALEGLQTFDEAMRVPHLLEHFNGFEMQEVLPALTLDLPFSKEKYVASIAERFGNQAIGDTVARICADGMAKFPIFVRPTLEGCLKQGILPIYAIRSIASWHQFARHVAAKKMPFAYVEPSWDDLYNILGKDAFVTSDQLWGELPETYPEFAAALRREISEMELKWPV
ncbi:MAG: mannitol dehydrogenase family protein [Aliishimia sp.]